MTHGWLFMRTFILRQFQQWWTPSPRPRTILFFLSLSRMSLSFQSWCPIRTSSIKHVPFLELSPRPFKLVIRMPESREVREQHVKLGVRCGNYGNLRVNHTKHNGRKRLQNILFKMLHPETRSDKTISFF